jgi:uncharacterized protein YqgC (DUF456 family)
MDWSQVGSLIAPMAPTIGSILGGFIPVPGGAVLGQVAGKIVAEALGVPPTPEAVNTAVTTGDPAVVSAKLSEAETKMNAEVERFRLSVQDVQDARATTVKLDASGSSIAWGAPVISVVIVVGFFSVMSLLFIIKTDFAPATVTLLNVLFGALIPAFGQVCNYWLGSSAGSANKDAIIASSPAVASAVVKKK